MNKKKIIQYILLFIVGIFVGYSLKPSIISAPIEYLPAEKVDKTDIPECNFGFCPEYQSMRVDKDFESMSVATAIVVRTAMTQGAGKVIIVKKGKIIFESSELPGIGVSEVEDGDGFILHYSSPRDENMNNVQYSVRYRYINGQFKPDDPGEKEKEKECVDNNGIWMKGPFGKEFFCNNTFSDGGKVCKDSSDCLSQQCLSSVTKDNGLSIVGVCSDRVTVYGCHGLVKEGKLTSYACID